MNRNNSGFTSILRGRPNASANIVGSRLYPSISGSVGFYQTPYGVIVSASIRGLPTSDDPCDSPVFAFHIHGGESCTGNENDPFADAGVHFNPLECPHPYHAGDMPPLFSANGYAYMTFLTNRFTINEVIGKAVIIHASPDDFTSQPSGNAGMKIACGIIRR